MVFFEKCTFCKENAIFLAFTSKQNGVHVHQERIKAIQNWPTPKTVGEVKSFHGVANFYQSFFQYFFIIASLLN